MQGMSNVFLQIKLVHPVFLLFYTLLEKEARSFKLKLILEQDKIEVDFPFFSVSISIEDSIEVGYGIDSVYKY